MRLRFGVHVLADGRVGCGLAKQKGQPKFSSGLNQPHASLGFNGTRRQPKNKQEHLFSMYVWWVQRQWWYEIIHIKV